MSACMYMCSLCIVTDDPRGNCLWQWDSPTWVSDSLLIPAYSTCLSCLENPRDGGAWWAAVCGVAQSRTRRKWLSTGIILPSKALVSKKNSSSSTKDIESVVLTNWLGGGVGGRQGDHKPLTKDIWKADMEAVLEKRPFRYLKSPCDSHFHLKNVVIWPCQVLAAACRIPSAAYRLLLSWGMWDLVPWVGMESRPSELGAQSLSHWTTREAPSHLLLWGGDIWQ